MARGLSVANDTAVVVDMGELGLENVEAVRGSDTETNVAFEVARMVLLSFFTRPMLREVLGCSHDELELVEGTGHGLWVDTVVEVAVSH